MHGTGGFPAFGNGPDHQGLAPAGIAGGEYAGPGGGVALIGADIPAAVQANQGRGRPLKGVSSEETLLPAKK